MREAKFKEEEASRATENGTFFPLLLCKLGTVFL